MPTPILRTLAVPFMLAAALVVAGCATPSPSRAAASGFAGQWSVKWCDKTDPDADCGGFTVDLTQTGDRIAGESFGARVRLAQVDEGGGVRGVAIGDTAILTVESARSGAIYLIEAMVRGDCMRWKMRDTVRTGERDIDIVAFDDVLVRRPIRQHADVSADDASDRCRAAFQRDQP